jgi:type VI protein secretion system component VasF
MVAEGFITRDRATRELTGTKWSKNIKKLGRETMQWVEAMRPLLELAAELAKAQQTPETMRARRAIGKTLKNAERALAACG